MFVGGRGGRSGADGGWTLPGTEGVEGVERRESGKIRIHVIGWVPSLLALRVFVFAVAGAGGGAM